jgi:hypothetical protein
MMKRTGERIFSATAWFGFALLAFWLPAGLMADEANRPFRGQAVGIANFTSSTTAIIQATGNATHLGKFTRTENVVLGANGAISGTVVFTAANGDQLAASFTGNFTSPTTATGTYTFTGGTGRFSDATGTASFQAATDGLHFTIAFQGTIGY